MTVYDIIPFNNELDLLEAHINTVKDFVDVFIITEAQYTFSGLKKPLYLKENLDRFKNVDILYVEANLPFKEHIFSKRMRYANELVQKNSFIKYQKFKKDDVLLIGDVDEIPHQYTKEILNNAKFDQPIRLQQKFYYYYLNCRCKDDWITGTVLTKGKWFIDASKTRMDSVPLIANPGGWHFSYLGDIQYKIGNLTEVEFDLDHFKTEEWIQECMRNQKDIFNRDIEWYIDELDVPPYIMQNLDKYDKYIFKG